MYELVGEMGLSYCDFIRMTFKQFYYAYAGFHKSETKKFEHTRVICWFIAAANRDPKKHFPGSPEKFWPLPTDKDQQRSAARDKTWANIWREKIRLVEQQLKNA